MPTLTKAARAGRIRELISRLRRDEEVQARDVDNVLSRKQKQSLTNAWKEQQELRKIEKPAEVTRYEKKLNAAVLLHGKLDRASASVKTRKQRDVVQNLRNKTDAAFEAAYECLQEVINGDQSLQIWFDKHIDFSAGTHLSIDPVGMPRVVTSRSSDNLVDVKQRFGWKTKAEVKIEALESALHELEADLAEPSEKKAKADADADARKLLRAKLEGLKRRDGMG